MDSDGLLFRLRVIEATYQHHALLYKAIDLLERGGEWREDGEDLLVYPANSTASGVRLQRWKERMENL